MWIRAREQNIRLIRAVPKVRKALVVNPFVSLSSSPLAPN